MKHETSALLDYLHQIAERSQAGEISWNQPNPSTFQWMQRSGDDFYHVTIQKADSPKRVRAVSTRRYSESEDSVYLFQVQDRAKKQTAISLSSRERPELYEALAKIYHGAEKGMDVRATGVLEKLLNG